MTIIEITKLYLDHKKWFYQEQADEISFVIELKDYRLFCSFHCLEETKQLIFYSHFPVKVSNKKLISMAILLTEINFGITIGNFELDMETNNIRYKTSIDVENTELNNALLENIVAANFGIATENYPKIFNLLSQKKAIIK